MMKLINGKTPQAVSLSDDSFKLKYDAKRLEEYSWSELNIVDKTLVGGENSGYVLQIIPQRSDLQILNQMRAVMVFVDPNLGRIFKAVKEGRLSPSDIKKQSASPLAIEEMIAENVLGKGSESQAENLQTKRLQAQKIRLVLFFTASWIPDELFFLGIWYIRSLELYLIALVAGATLPSGVVFILWARKLLKKYELELAQLESESSKAKPG